MPSIPWIIKITTYQSDKVSAHLRRGLEPDDLIGGVCRIRLLGNLEKVIYKMKIISSLIWQNIRHSLTFCVTTYLPVFRRKAFNCIEM
jgi:hypothetical protein